CLRVSFGGPVLPGAPVQAAAGRRDDRWWATASARGKQLLRVEAWADDGIAAIAPPPDRGAPMRREPADVDLDALAPGFGAAAALALLDAGHAVHVVYAVSADAAQELRAAAGEAADRLTLHRADARDPGDLEAVTAAIREAGLPVRGVLLSAASPPLPMR